MISLRWIDDFPFLPELPFGITRHYKPIRHPGNPDGRDEDTPIRPLSNWRDGAPARDVGGPCLGEPPMHEPHAERNTYEFY